MSRITNTTKRADENPLEFLAMAIALGPSDAILAQEAAGQAQLVESSSLPTDCRGQDDLLRQIGFELGEPFPDDPIFRPAKFPPGWGIRATSHAMGSILHDAKDRRRGNIFYKAAYYDRKAYMHLIPRFRVGVRYCNEHGETAFDEAGGQRFEPTHEQAAVEDDGKVVFSMPMTTIPDGTDREALAARYDQQQAEEKQCEAWLDERYPDWKSPVAYWETEG